MQKKPENADQNTDITISANNDQVSIQKDIVAVKKRVPIRVHLLNFHGTNSHIEIVLENLATSPQLYYNMDRWSTPAAKWTESAKENIDDASSTCVFDIDADPDEIVSEWRQFWASTDQSASVLANNCADAAQWFLTKFANIPKPNLSNYSLNHLAMGIFWPSYIPCPITLPGRVMSNAEFYVEVRGYHQLPKPYSKLFYHITMTLAVFTFAVSIAALVLAATILTGGIAGCVIAGSAVLAFGSSHVFFESNARLSARKMAKELQQQKALELGNDTPLSLPKQDLTVFS